MTTAHCSAVTGSAYEAMMIACTWIGVRDDDGRFRGEDGDGDGDGDDDVCEDVLEKYLIELLKKQNLEISSTIF